jgi:hypothetical protein
MEPINAIADAVRRYLVKFSGRPIAMRELIEQVESPWLRPSTRAEVVAAVEKLCTAGLLEEHRNSAGRPFYRLANRRKPEMPVSSAGED